MEKVVTVILLLGLLSSGLGVISWVLGLLERYNISWELRVAVLGMILVLVGIILAKIFSRE
jgi:hypothetical protein